MVLLEIIIAVAGMGAVGGAGTYIYKRRHHYRADHKERHVEAEAGLDGTERKVESAEGQVRSVIENLEHIDRKERALEGESISVADKKIVQAGEEAVETAEAVAAGDEDQTEITEGEVATTAGLEMIEKALERYLNKKPEWVFDAEDFTSDEEGFVDDISELTNLQQIDSKTILAIKEHAGDLKANMDKNIGAEGGQIVDIENLTSSIHQAAVELDDTFHSVFKEEGRFKVHIRKTRSRFIKDRSKLWAAIHKKRAQLWAALKISRGADHNVVSKIKKELELLKKQYSAIKSLNAQVQLTIKHLKEETKKVRSILKNMKKLDKELSKHYKNINKIIKMLKEKRQKFSQEAEDFSKYIENINIELDVGIIAVTLSKKLSQLTQKMISLNYVNGKFIEFISNLTSICFTFARQEEGFIKINNAIKEGDEAVGEGVKYLTHMLQAIYTNPEFEVDQERVREQMDKLKEAVDYEKKVEKELYKILSGLGSKVRSIYQKIKQLKNQEAHAVTMLKSSSSHLGSLMGRALGRKVKIDQTMVNHARQFESQLKSRNAAAARAYNRVRSAPSNQRQI